MAHLTLALGGGAARGFAHIGVLRALEEAGQVPAAVVGTSMGALVGAFAAAGALARLEAWVRQLDPLQVLRLLDIRPGGGGLVQGERLMAALGELLPDAPMESFPRRFAAVAAELESGRAVVFSRGSWMRAVRASIAFPGLLPPLRHEGRYLVDGGLAEPVPVAPARGLGRGPVVAVHVNLGLVPLRLAPESPPALATIAPAADLDPFSALALELRLSLGELRRRWLDPLLGGGREGHGPGYFDVAYGAILLMQDRLTRARLAAEPPDLLIAPRVAHIGLFEFHRSKEAIAAGLEAGRLALAGVRALLDWPPSAPSADG